LKKICVVLALALLIVSACKKQAGKAEAETTGVNFANVVILGNSITYSQQNLAIGWKGNWGMAATEPAKDYVHLLTARFLAANKTCVVQAANIADFEQNYSSYNFDTQLKAYRDSKPDLLILRIGENVQSTFDAAAFSQRYQALIEYMKVNNPDLKVLAAGSFWPQREYINNIMSQYTPYLSLVKGHPGDKGMQGIADMIWAKVETMK
jgi:lysophospholipase L1-like esterase